VKLTPKQKAALKKEAIKTILNIIVVVITLSAGLAFMKHQLSKAEKSGLIGVKKVSS